MQAIAEGTLQEAHAEDGEVKSALGDGSFRGVAVHRATALLLDEARVPADLALRFLPWLLSASPSDSLAVLKVSATIKFEPPGLGVLCSGTGEELLETGCWSSQHPKQAAITGPEMQKC